MSMPLLHILICSPDHKEMDMWPHGEHLPWLFWMTFPPWLWHRENLIFIPSLTFPPSDLCIKESQIATLFIFFPWRLVFLDKKSYFPFHVVPHEEHFLSKNCVDFLNEFEAMKVLVHVIPGSWNFSTSIWRWRSAVPSCMPRRVETPC